MWFLDQLGTTVTELQAEAELDPTIRTEAVPQNPVTEPASIFLTGSTGFQELLYCMSSCSRLGRIFTACYVPLTPRKWSFGPTPPSRLRSTKPWRSEV